MTIADKIKILDLLQNAIVIQYITNSFIFYVQRYFMGIRKKRKTIKENREIGADGENTQYYKEFAMHNLNPFSDNHVERHEKNNDPYDYVRVNERTGRRRYVEVKTGNAKQSPQEKKFQSEHPKSYELNRTGTHSQMNDLRKLKKKLLD